MHKWGLVPLANCRWGEEKAKRSITYSSFLSPVSFSKWDTHDLAALDDDTLDWLQTTALNI